jgi:cellulose synthase (UDP-forming)
MTDIELDVRFIGALVLALLYLAFLPRLGRQQTATRSAVTLIAMFCMAQYLVWLAIRVYTYREVSLAFLGVLTLFGIELFYRCQQIGSMSAGRRISNRTSEASANAEWWKASPPSVHVLIPSYNEKYEVLERTFVGARSIAYANVRVHVLDDGARPWVKDLAESFGINYIARSSNAGYKAGNINHAVRTLISAGERADFFVIFDADFICLPTFVERVLALMGPNHSDVALVQTPHYYLNPDPFLFAFNNDHALPDDQRFFYDNLLPVWDVNHGAFCCGSALMIRAEALLQAGFFPEDTLAEDFYMSIRLRELGWKTVYLNEVLSLGLAAEGLAEFLVQRYRWSMGWSQISRATFKKNRQTKSFPLALWEYIKMLSIWPVPGIVKISWLSLPALITLTHGNKWLPVAGQFGAVFVPLLVSHLGLQWLNRGTSIPLYAEANGLLAAPTAFRSLYNFFTGRENHKFVVTDKGINRQRWSFHSRAAALPLILGALNLLALVVNARAIDSDARFDQLLLMLMSCANLVTLYIALTPCFEPPQTRAARRFPADSRFEFTVRPKFGSIDEPIKVEDISELGMKFKSARSYECGDSLEIVCARLELKIAARVIRQSKAGAVCVSFGTNSQVRRELLREIYCVQQRVPILSSWRADIALLWVLRHLLFLTPGNRRASHRGASFE